MLWFSATIIVFIAFSHNVPPCGSQWNHTVSRLHVTEPPAEPSQLEQRSGEGELMGKIFSEGPVLFITSCYNMGGGGTRHRPQ